MSTDDLSDEEKALLAQAEEGEQDGLAGNPQAPGIAATDSDGPVADVRMRTPTAEPGEKTSAEETSPTTKKPRKGAPKPDEEQVKAAEANAENADPSTPAQYSGADGLPAQMSYEQ